MFSKEIYFFKPTKKKRTIFCRLFHKTVILLISFCLLASVILVNSCATLDKANDPEELVRTFNRAYMTIPEKYFPNGSPSITNDVFWGQLGNEYTKDELNKIPHESKIPLVIYMHGCWGIGIHALRFMEFLAWKNYAVVAPNSNARKYKPKSCEPETHTGGLHRRVLSFRLAEAKYMHEVAKTFPWIDKRNIFMMGFSQGGTTTAKYSRGDLAGRIVLGWGCNSGWPEYKGLSGPRDEPILAVVASNDPWFRHPSDSGHCGEFMLFRKNSESIVIDVNFHEVLTLMEVKEKVLEFLKKNTTLNP